MTIIRLPAKITLTKLWFFLVLIAATTLTPFAQTLDHFEFSVITSPKHAYVPFRVIITAKSSTGATVRTFTGTVQLTASSLGTPIEVESNSPLKFSLGSWVGNIAINDAVNGVILRVRDTVSGRTGTSGEIHVETANFRIVNLPVVSLASDQLRGVLYCSAGPTNGPLGAIHVIDPDTGSVLQTHSVEGGVERLELSSDSTKLYAVTDDQRKVRRFHLPDFTEEIVLDLGESEPGIPNHAADLAIHPLRPEVVAVVKKRRDISPWFAGLSVFENSVEKTTANRFIGEATAVAFADDSERLFGLNNQSSLGQFTEYDLTTPELSVLSTRWNLFTLFNGDIRFIDGKIYCTTGRIIDSKTFNLLGELPGGHEDALMLALPDRKRNVYFTPASIGFILTYDSETLQFLGSEPFPMPRGYGSGAAFWGDNGIAFHDGVRLFLSQNKLIPTTSAPADLELSPLPTTTPAGGDYEMKALVRNLGPNPSGPILINITGPVDALLTSGFSPGQSSAAEVEDRHVALELASLASGAQVDVTFTARTAVPVWHPFSVVATAAALDPNGANNAVAMLMKSASPNVLSGPVPFRLATRAMAADPTRGLLFVATSASLAPWGNSILKINPQTGEVSQPLLVGSRPSELAVSDDGKYLYVGFLGLSEVRRFLLPSLEHDLTIPLGSDGISGYRFARDLAVRPGHSSEIAVARFNFTSETSADRLGYFRNATDLFSNGTAPELVAFGGPNQLYGHADSWGVFKFDITNEGVAYNKLLSQAEVFNTSGFTVDNGKLYFSNGSIFNAETGSPSGEFFTFGPFGPPPIIDPEVGRALFLQRTLTNFLIAAYDLNNYSQAASNAITGVTGTANSFTRWSANGMAFSTSTGIGMLQTDLLGSPTPTLRIEGINRNGGTLTIRLGARPAGQYLIEHTIELDTTWSPVGDPFPETAAEIQLTPAGSKQQFFRLAKVP